MLKLKKAMQVKKNRLNELFSVIQRYRSNIHDHNELCKFATINSDYIARHFDLYLDISTLRTVNVHGSEVKVLRDNYSRAQFLTFDMLSTLYIHKKYLDDFVAANVNSERLFYIYESDVTNYYVVFCVSHKAHPCVSYIAHLTPNHISYQLENKGNISKFCVEFPDDNGGVMTPKTECVGKCNFDRIFYHSWQETFAR